ncbi:MAG: serine/threonine-protein kinase, partial [Stackebrandtia sp.]
MRVGTQLGNRYRLDERIDGGGPGETWKGHDTLLERTVAVKVMHVSPADDPTFRRRFHAEARNLAALQAPGAAGLFDYGEDASYHSAVISYLVMEFVSGRSLREVLAERGGLDPGKVLEILAQAAQALHDAHRENVVHKDLRPENILIEHASASVKLIGFGVARSRLGDDAGRSRSNEPGTGNFAYVAPEMLRGQTPTAASDIYALGAVAYECLGGQPPNDGKAASAEQPLAALPPNVPETVVEIVARALDMHPARRWESAADLAKACRELRAPRTLESPIVDARPLGDAAPTMAAASAALARASKPAKATVAIEPEPKADSTEALEASQRPVDDGPKPVKKDAGRRFRKNRMLIVAATVAALVFAGGVVAASVMDKDDANNASDDGQGVSGGADDDSSSEGKPSRGSGGAAPAEEEEEDDSADDSEDSDQSTDENTGIVPGVLGLQEGEAVAALADAGFT